MKISVIIPTLNEATIIESSLRRAWECGADEVVVCDGGSSDATLSIASSNCTLVESEPGRGIQLNAGARIATGEVLLFLHADNWLTRDGCQQIRNSASLFKTPICGAFRQRIEADQLAYRLIEFGNRLRVSLFSMAYGDQGIFVSRSLFESLGGFEEIPLLEDFSFSRRLRKQHRYRLLKGPLFVSPRRWKKNGAIGQTLANWNTVLAYYRGVSPVELANAYHRTEK